MGPENVTAPLWLAKCRIPAEVNDRVGLRVSSCQTTAGWLYSTLLDTLINQLKIGGSVVKWERHQQVTTKFRTTSPSRTPL
jgi:hypothetical protein